MALPPIPAVTPLNLAAVNNGAALTENWGRATAYFQRYLQDMVRGITASITNLQDIITVIEAIIVELDAAIADIAAQQIQIDNLIIALFDQDVALRALIATERNRINGLASFQASFKYGVVGPFAPTAGYVNIAHGLALGAPDPGNCTVNLYASPTPATIQIVSVTSSFIVCYIQDFTGVAYGGAVTISWSAHYT